MTLIPLASRSPDAVRDALVRRGMDGSRAAAASQGLHPVALILDALSPHELDALAGSARRDGIECLTGQDWALLAGTTARLAGMIRPGHSTVPLGVAQQMGTFLRRLSTPPEAWVTARGAIALDRPLVVGILNVTPDSFSDGGAYLDPGAAVRHATGMIESGADLIDIGAESTRPGRPDPVTADEEWRRLAPVVTTLADRYPGVPLSVDTVKAATAERALDAGAWAVNDVSGLRIDPRLAEVCAGRGAGIVLMHSRGSFSEMATYDHASYRDVIVETMRELGEAAGQALEAGVPAGRIVLDPGIGFSKNPEQSFEVLRGLPALGTLGFPLMVGPSRKRFLGDATGRRVDQRDDATASACVAAYMLGATLFRVHAVDRVRQALDVAARVRSA